MKFGSSDHKSVRRLNKLIWAESIKCYKKCEKCQEVQDDVLKVLVSSDQQTITPGVYYHVRQRKTSNPPN